MQRKSESVSRAGAHASSVGAVLLLGAFGGQVAHAQAIMRTPTISAANSLRRAACDRCSRISATCFRTRRPRCRRKATRRNMHCSPRPPAISARPAVTICSATARPMLTPRSLPLPLTERRRLLQRPIQQNVKMRRNVARRRERARWNSPRCRAHLINRRFLRQIGRTRASLGCDCARRETLKYRGRPLNVRPSTTTKICGSGHPSPSVISGASAHPPQAPIWLDPSGCPPGRVFPFWGSHSPATFFFSSGLSARVRSSAVDSLCALQGGDACGRLDCESAGISARLRSLATKNASSLDKSKLFHKIIPSRLN
jgi:hypothetical protein